MSLLSDNIIQKLCLIYTDLTKEQILATLSSAPSVTTIRVNTTLISIEEAKEELTKYVLEMESGGKFLVANHPAVLDVLLVSANLNHDSRCLCKKEVIVDTTCGAAVLRGADIYVPGVLAAHAGMKKGDEVSVYADLENKCRRGLSKDFSALKFFVGNGIAICDRQSIFATKLKSGIAIQMKTELPTFSGLNTKLFFPQNLPSTLVAHILNPQPTERVLDMCAAPGGKTTHIATLLNNQGTVISIDKSINKVAKVHENCKRLQLSNVYCFSYDSTKLYDERCSNQGFDKSPPYCARCFDKILLDPPCSGLGQRPQLRYVKSDTEVSSYPIYQRKLIKQAYELLKLDGILVYSTCTLLPSENEEQVSWILKTYPNLKLQTQEPFLGNTGLAGYGLTEEERSKVQRFDKMFTMDKLTTKCTDDVIENSNTDSIGFFIAKFRKLSTA